MDLSPVLQSYYTVQYLVLSDWSSTVRDLNPWCSPLGRDADQLLHDPLLAPIERGTVPARRPLRPPVATCSRADLALRADLSLRADRRARFEKFKVSTHSAPDVDASLTALLSMDI